MEERELRITYGMCFKLAGDIVAQQELSALSSEVIVDEISTLAEQLTHAALGGQEAITSHYSHMVTAAPKKSSGGFSRSSGRKASSSPSSASKGPRDPSAPATEKQVALATKLYWSKDHDLDVDPDSFNRMSMGEISPLIDELLNA